MHTANQRQASLTSPGKVPARQHMEGMFFFIGSPTFAQEPPAIRPSLTLLLRSTTPFAGGGEDSRLSRQTERLLDTALMTESATNDVENQPSSDIAIASGASLPFFLKHESRPLPIVDEL